MAFDEILFRQINRNTLPAALRFYVSSEPWISTGVSDPIWKAYNSSPTDPAASVRKDFSQSSVVGRTGSPGSPYVLLSGVKICRRITGGGQVLHGKDLIFSLVTGYDQDDAFQSVKASYVKIHEAVKSGLEGLGRRPRFWGSQAHAARSHVCFRFPVSTDLVVGRKKVAGGAQKRSRFGFLHQESLHLPHTTNYQSLAAAVRRGFETVFQVEFQSEDLDPKILKQAE
ncbi:MAG: hypothetical protein NC930_09010, partial [Candidatus Omnitrophica bacterium]|nr:hypothetical protein [Candidatus Omnitrophota bacterium]